MSILWNPGTGKPRVVVGSLVHIPKDLVDMDQLRAELTVKNDVYWQSRQIGSARENDVEPVYELWEETDTVVSVPRHYLEQRRGNMRLFKEAAPDFFRSASRPPRVRPVPHAITLRDATQAEASRALSEEVGDKIISLACGKGKTVVSLHAAAEGKRFPLLIVVHTNALLDQWRANYNEHGELIGGIKKFYNLDESEIGHIQGKAQDWRGKKVALAMLKTLVLKEFDLEFYNYWRTIIFDEVHRLGAHFFQRAASMFPGERWGLSATVEREDKMDLVFRMHLGDVVYQDLEQPLKPNIFFVATGVQVDIQRFTIRRTGRVNLAALQTHLSEHTKRNELILRWVRKAYEKGRTILVLGERLSQLHWMAETLSAEGLDVGVYVGSTRQEDRQDALRRRVIFATQHIAKEGLDKGALDTLFVLIPFGGKGRLQQSVGRILRIHGTKQKPVVVIFEDGIGIIGSLGRKMRRFIRSFGYEPREVSAKKEVK